VRLPQTIPPLASVEQGRTDSDILFCRNAGHGVGNAKAQFLPHAIEWVWKEYAPKKSN
jgi:hypothetical protein